LLARTASQTQQECRAHVRCGTEACVGLGEGGCCPALPHPSALNGSVTTGKGSGRGLRPWWDSQHEDANAADLFCVGAGSSTGLRLPAPRGNGGAGAGGRAFRPS